MVHRPEINVDNSASTKAYPVVYVLDGEALFETTLKILKSLSKSTGDSIFSQAMVVGVGNIWQRDRDYTPTRIISSPFVDDMAARQSGGGEKFVLFLEKELIPYVNSKYPASSKRVLIGHSLGGLTVMNILLNHKELFSGYAAIDPSMWWDDENLLKQSKTILSETKFENVSLFLAIANTMNKEMSSVSEIKKDDSKNTILIRPSIKLTDYLNANKQNKLRFYWKYYKDQNHISVYPSAVSDALEFLLKNF
jgi:predicted alpha/beta superfamily hydrolase